MLDQGVALCSDVLQRVFIELDPLMLLQVASVDKLWYSVARCNSVWIPHRDRILKLLPMLEPIFETYGKATQRDNGKRIKLTKRPKQATGWMKPHGIWNVFVSYLLFKSIKHVKKHVLEAVCWAATDPTVALEMIQYKWHPALDNDRVRFAHCVCVSGFRFYWIAMFKRDKTIRVYGEGEAYESNSIDRFIHNFICIVQNRRLSSYYYLIK